MFTLYKSSCKSEKCRMQNVEVGQKPPFWAKNTIINKQGSHLRRMEEEELEHCLVYGVLSTPLLLSSPVVAMLRINVTCN